MFKRLRRASTMKLTMTWFLVGCALLASGVTAQQLPFPNKANERIDVLVEASKPYDALIAEIERLGGQVRYAYTHIDALAATLPGDRIDALAGLRETGTIVEDRQITHGEPRSWERAGFGVTTDRHDLGASDIAGIVTAPLSSATPDGYFSDVVLTRALDFWTDTGNLGQGVIIGIMDDGLGPVPALGARIVGGESFLSLTPGLDDGFPAVSPLNGSHGTWVATAAGANVGFCIPVTATLVQSIRTHLPEATIPNGCGPGVDLVPMLGQAPAAEFFALKVFNRSGRTSGSALLAGFDRAIELKTLYDAGTGGVNIRVLNGSFGGGTLFAGDDPFFAGMIDAVTAAGIVTVFSASNGGPSGMTGGDPGTARQTLTVGATSFAPYERILRDLQFGLGTGALYRANDRHQTASFSSRGPTADGRTDPDITAPGFAVLAQGAGGGINIISGTSFSAPMVAGAAALLLSAYPDATPGQIRGALLVGADPNVLEDNSGPFDQGFGFLDVLGAYHAFGAPTPVDQGEEDVVVKTNVEALGVEVISSRNATRSTGWLLPGERAEFFFDTKATDVGLAVQVTVTAESPPSEQNVFFGDDAIVAIHSAKTSSFDDYRGGTPTFVPSTATFDLGPTDLDEGLTRITVAGDWTNAGRIQATVEITTDKAGRALRRPINGRIAAEDGFNVHMLDIEPGTTELILTLDWSSDWSMWPTNDLDLYVLTPDFDLVLVDGDADGDWDGLSVDAPERLVIANPTPGQWTLLVDGFTIWNRQESYQITAHTTSASGEGIAVVDEVADTGILSNAFPQPFNPRTRFASQAVDAQEVQTAVFDRLGRLAAVPYDGILRTGERNPFRFGSTGRPSGMYVYRAAEASAGYARRITLEK